MSLNAFVGERHGQFRQTWCVCGFTVLAQIINLSGTIYTKLNWIGKVGSCRLEFICDLVVSRFPFPKWFGGIFSRNLWPTSIVLRIAVDYFFSEENPCETKGRCTPTDRWQRCCLTLLVLLLLFAGSRHVLASNVLGWFTCSVCNKRSCSFLLS